MTEPLVSELCFDALPYFYYYPRRTVAGYVARAAVAFRAAGTLATPRQLAQVEDAARHAHGLAAAHVAAHVAALARRRLMHSAYRRRWQARRRRCSA